MAFMNKKIYYFLPLLFFSCTPNQLTHQRYLQHSFEIVNYVEFDSDSTFIYSYQNGLLQGTKKGVYIKEGQNYLLNTVPDTTDLINPIHMKNTSGKIKGNKLILSNFLDGREHSLVLKHTNKRYRF